MGKTSKKIMGIFAAIIVIAAIILCVFLMITKDANKKAQVDALPTTEVGKILAKDLDTKYPETPTEVVKLYWRINRCMYNEEGLSETNIEDLLKKIRALYDDEFLNDDNNSFENMLENLKKDIKARQDKKQILTATVVQKNADVEEVVLDGKECATVITSTLIKAKGEASKVYESFLCRKDDDNKWKILGWQQISAEEAADAEIE